MLLRFILTIIVFLQLLCFNVSAEDLLFVVRKAFENNYDYRSKVEQYNADYVNKNLAKSYILPSVNLSADYNIDDNSNKLNNDGSLDYNTQSNQLVVDLMQPLFDLEAWSYYNKAKLQAKRAEIELDKEKNDVILKSAQYYFDVLSSIDDLEYINAKITYLKNYMNEISQKIDVGENKAVDIEEVKAKYKNAEYERISIINELNVRKDLLNKLINENIESYYAVKYDIISNVAIDDIDQETWINRALAQNLDILYSRISLLITDEDINTVSAGYYPKISLVAGYSISSDQTPADDFKVTENLDDMDNQRGYVGVKLNINLYQGGSTNTQKKQKLFVKKSQQYGLQELENKINNTVIEYYLNVYNGISQLNALEQSLVSAKKTLDYSTRSYKIGLKTTTDVLIATEDFFNTKRDLSHAKYKFLLSILALKSVSGILKESDVVVINNYLDKQN